MARLAPLAATRFAVGLLAASVKPLLLPRLLSLDVAPASIGFWLALLESLWTSGYIAAVAPLVLLSGRVGRKAVICATLLVFTLGISTISLTPSLAVLALACFVCGLAESTNAVIRTYVAQTLPLAQTRAIAQLSAAFQSGIVIGPLVAPALDALAARTLHHAVAAMTLAVVGAAVSLGAYLSLPSSRRSMPSADCEKTILLETEPLLTKALPIEPTRRSSQLHLPVMMTLIGTGQAVNSMLLMLVATSTTSSFGLGLSSLGRAETFTALALFNIVFQLGLFDRIVKCMGSKRACAMLAFAYPLEIAVVALYIAGPTTHPWVPLGAMLAVSATASMSMLALQIYVMDTTAPALLARVNGHLELAVACGYLLGNALVPTLWSIGLAHRGELGVLASLFALVSLVPLSAALL